MLSRLFDFIAKRLLQRQLILPPQGLEMLYDLLDQPLGRRSSSRHTNAARTFDVIRIYFILGLDQETFLALLFADREELHAVR